MKSNSLEGTYTGSIKYREDRFVRNQEFAERQEAYAARYVTSLELRADNTFDLQLDVPMDGVWEKHEYGIKMTPRNDSKRMSAYWRNGDELIFKIEDGGKRLESMGSSGSYYEFIKD
jgi:hypothetical protein